MLKILEITFPFFALVWLGWLAARQRWLPLDAIPGLNHFVLYLALPAMLLRFAAATPIARMFDPVLFGIWLCGALAMTGLALAWARRRTLNWNDAAFGALVAAFPNSGFMGVPLLVDLLGPGAAAPAIVALAVDMVLTSSLCIAVSRLSDPGRGGAPAAALKALRGMAANPLPWAIATGCLISGAEVSLPAWLGRPLNLLADAASPTALFTLGAVLARSQSMLAASRHPAAAARPIAADDTWPIVALKLIVHPLLVYGLCGAVTLAGGALAPEAAVVLPLVAALPSASNVPVLAERFGADAGRLARIVLLTTTGAFASFTLGVRWLTG